MAQEAQRIRGKAARLREERAERNGGQRESPEEGADLGASPIVDEEDRIARSEALSTFRSEDDMRGLGTPDDGRAEEIEQLGAGLAQQVDSRMQDWMDGWDQKFTGQIEGVTGAKPQSFVVGALFGGLILALGVLLGGRNQNR
jgi:hypothetical protein